MSAYYFRVHRYPDRLGKKVIYFPDSKSEGFSYWEKDKDKTPGTLPWNFKKVRAWKDARKITRATAKRYIKIIP